MKKFCFLVTVILVASACTPKNYYLFQSKDASYSKFDVAKKDVEEKISAQAVTIEDIELDSNLEVPLAIATTNDKIIKEEVVREQAKAIKSITKIKKIVEEKKEAKESGVKLTRSEKKENRKALKKAKKDFKESLKAIYQESSGKSQLVALLLVIFVGALGIHRFYLGYTTIGIIQLLTLGGCGIWALIDLIRIATGDLKPEDGDYEETI